MRLGVFGGSFNPIHLGHLSLAEAVTRVHGLQRVLFVPAGRPPHKMSRDLVSAEDRLEMVRLAVAGRTGFEASALETSRPGPSYTFETLEQVHLRWPEADLFFIIGEDTISELPGWRNPARILELARVVAVNRPGSSATFRREAFPGVPEEVLDRLERDRVWMEPCPIESRAIRATVARGGSIAGLVPPPVASYIERRGLYRGAASLP